MTVDQTESLDEWGFSRGDEIVPGLTAMRLLGGGSAYEAYLAFDDVLYAPVVVKLVRPGQVEDRSTLRGLAREVDMLGRLNHPAIVRGFRADVGGDRPHVVLESLDGPRLSTLIRKHGALPMQQLLPLGIELASAAHYLHHLDVCHLDIKPSNIIMGAPARLIDLSVARSRPDAAALRTPIGTDLYMAPEQCTPGETMPPCAASDMWGIGATMFNALAGFRPFDRGIDEPEATDEQRWPQLVAAPARLPARTPADVAAAVLSCLARDPAARPSPAAFAEALEPAMAALPKAKLSGFRVALS